MSSTVQGEPGTMTDVGAYAAEVRRHLAGLPPEQVDDLTDGLEADLAEARDDAGVPAGAADADLVARFGPPADYARELRVAAGLPEPAVPTTPRARRRPLLAVRTASARAAAGLRAQPWWPAARDLADSVRPIWWLARAWIFYQLAMTFTNIEGQGVAHGWVPTDLSTVLLFLVLAVVSIQWGRGRWRAGWLRWLPVVASVVAVLTLPSALIEANNGAVRWRTQYVTVDPGAQASPDDGVLVDGMQVSNLFVYDKDGQPLSDVQIYDDRGRPVRTFGPGLESGWALPGVPEPWTFVPAHDGDGRARWNVYPLLGAPTASFDWEQQGEAGSRPLLPGEQLRVPPLPFAQAPALVDDHDSESSADAGSGSAPTVGPTAGATP